MHLPGRQVDPRQVQRDIWRLGRWERERLERAAAGRAPRAAPRRLGGMSAAGNGHFDLKHRSRALTEGRDRAAARAYLKGIGYDDEALSKPIIGVANTWIETMPCNFHLRALAEARQGRHQGRRRHADGVQHGRDLRRHHDGHAAA